MSENIFPISRDPIFSWATVSITSANSFKIERTEVDSQLVQRIDLADLEIKTVLDIENPVANVNEVLESRFADLKANGYILLDAYVCRFLMSHKGLIPKDWSRITESESFSDESGTLRFDGTIFRNISSGEEVILAPFCSRGEWGYGFCERRFSEKNVNFYQKNAVRNKQYSVVIHRDRLK